MEDKIVKCHAYGAGVQSIAIMYKYLNNEFEKPDVVVFADTQAEPEDVYAKVERDKKVCKDNGIRFETVTFDNLLLPKHPDRLYIPAFTLNKHGKKGSLLRSCTDRFKIQPIRKFLRKNMGAKKVEMWLGISTDEAGRMKDSRVKYAVNKYPLIDANMSRKDCIEYLDKIGVSASKSACIMCPFRSSKTWAKIRENESDWKKAVEYDNRIREIRKSKNVLLFTHQSMKPLEIAVDGDRNQSDLFMNECEGYCGL